MNKATFSGLVLLALAIVACLLPDGFFSQNPVIDVQVTILLYVLSLCSSLLVLVHAHKQEVAHARRRQASSKQIGVLLALGMVLGLGSCTSSFTRCVTPSGLVVLLDTRDALTELHAGDKVPARAKGNIYVVQPPALTTLNHTYLIRGPVDTLTLLE